MRAAARVHRVRLNQRGLLSGAPDHLGVGCLGEERLAAGAWAMVVLAARGSRVEPFLPAGGIGRTMTGMGKSLACGAQG